MHTLPEPNVNNRNTKHIDFLMNCLVELYSLDVQKSFEKVVMSVGQLNAILRLASKTKEKVCINSCTSICECTLFLTRNHGYEIHIKSLIEKILSGYRGLGWIPCI
jgi:hypothetical protein